MNDIVLEVYFFGNFNVLHTINSTEAKYAVILHPNLWHKNPNTKHPKSPPRHITELIQDAIFGLIGSKLLPVSPANSIGIAGEGHPDAVP